MKNKTIIKTLSAVVVMTMAINITACKDREIPKITETLPGIESVVGSESYSARVAFVESEDGSTRVIVGQVVESNDNSDDTVTILDEDTGEEVEVKVKDLLPDDTEYVETTVKTEDGSDITIEGAILSKTATTTTVVDLKTGIVHEVEKSSTTTTTVPVVTRTTETSNKETTIRKTEATSERITETVPETTKPTVKETTASATKPTAKPTTQEATTAAPTTTKPTTQEATTAAPTTTQAPTTQATTTAPTTTAAPTTTQAPTTQATTTAPTTTAATEAPTEATLPLHYNKVDTATFVQQSFAEVNKMRAEVGAAPVVMAPQIVQDYAMLRAREEGENWSWVNDTDHYRPDGEGSLTYLFTLYYDGLINRPLTENGASADLWRYTGAEMTRDYVESAGHYNNIIDTRAGSVAIGYYYNEKLWVAFQIIIFLEK